MQSRVDETNALLVKERENAKKAIEEAPAIVQETKVIVEDTQKIEALTAEVESLKVIKFSLTTPNLLLSGPYFNHAPHSMKYCRQYILQLHTAYIILRVLYWLLCLCSYF